MGYCVWTPLEICLVESGGQWMKWLLKGEEWTG